jgi:hypothetical protein
MTLRKTNNQNCRFVGIDFIKSISIVGVVAIHSLNTEVSLLVNILVQYFGFCVPIFIISSFFLLETRTNNTDLSTQKVNNIDCEGLIFRNTDWLKPLKTNYFQITRRRIFKLLKPYLFYSVFYYCFFHWNQFAPIDLVQLLKSNVVGAAWAGQYYLILMIQLTLIYPIVRGFNWSYKNCSFVISLILLFVYLPIQYFKFPYFISKIGFVLFIYSIPYIIFGIFCARQGVFLKKIKQEILLALLALAPILIIFEFQIFKDLNRTGGYAYFSYLISSFIIFICIINLEKFFLSWDYRILKFFQFVSNNILGIYCINIACIFFVRDLVILHLNNVLAQKINPDICWLVTFLSSFTISLIISSRLKKYSLTSGLV